jgi:phthalate 4,5-cis-dihydrodiol dehydrogenase
MDQGKLRLGVVGLGMAGGAMIAAVGTHPRVALAAAADPSPELRSAFGQGEALPAYPTLADLLADTTVEAVYIATPHQLHAGQVIAAAEAGRHVVVEKPMGLTLADADSMVAAAQANGVHLIVGHTHGFSPSVLEIRRIVASGEFGELAMIAQWNYTNFLYRPRRPEELDTARGGGIIFNQIPHQVEILRTIADRDVVSLRASTTSLDPSRPTEGACMAQLDLSDGVSASLVYSGYDHFDSDELHGWVAEGGGDKTPAHGSAIRSLRTLDAASEVQARRTGFGYGNWSKDMPPYQPHFGELIVSLAGADIRCSKDGLLIYSAEGVEERRLTERPWRPGRGDVLEELVTAVRDGAAPIHDGGFGRETLRVCLAIKDSAGSHQQIQLNERKDRAHV